MQLIAIWIYGISLMWQSGIAFTDLFLITVWRSYNLYNLRNLRLIQKLVLVRGIVAVSAA